MNAMNAELELPIDVNARSIVSRELGWAYRILRFQLLENEYHFYVEQNHPSSQSTQELEIIFGRKIKFIPKQSDVIERALSKHFVKESSSTSIQTSTSSLDIKNKE